MARTAMAVLVISLLLTTAIFVLPLFRGASANPSVHGIWSPPESVILSPSENGTYHSSVPLRLTVTIFASGLSYESVKNLTYSLDGKPDAKLSFDTNYGGGPKSTFLVNDVLSGLTDGQHFLAVYGLTDGGNTFNSNVTFIVDAIPPSVSILSPQDTNYNSTEILFDLAVSEPTSKITYSIDGENNITIGGNSTLTELSGGAHNLTVYAWDIAGNIGASQTIRFSVDAPFMPLLIVVVSMAVAGVVTVAALVYLKKRGRV